LILYFYHICLIPGGLNHLIRQIIFSIHGHGKWFLKNCITFLWSEEIIVIGYNLVSFLHNFFGEYFCLTKCNVLFNNEHLILIRFFLLIDNEFDFKITLRLSNFNNIYMLDTNLEPSFNLSKNLLLLPWILKLIVDMVNDSTPMNK